MQDAIASAAIRNLFQTGNFDDVQIGHDGSVLVVQVEERPSISEIKIDGNKSLEDRSADGGPRRSRGSPKASVQALDTRRSMRQELTHSTCAGPLRRQHSDEVIAEPRNRVSVHINIDEGNTARINHIAMSATQVRLDELHDVFELENYGHGCRGFTDNDKYSREKARKAIWKNSIPTTSIAALPSFVSIPRRYSTTPDRKAVYITVNVAEGDEYNVGQGRSVRRHHFAGRATCANLFWYRAGKPFAGAGNQYRTVADQAPG